MQTFPLEWAEVSPGLVVVATPEQGWVYRPGAWSLFGAEMEGPGSPETTRRLLETAVAAGRAEAPSRPYVSRFSLAFWAWWLCGAHVTTRETPHLLVEAAARLERSGRESIARWARQRAVEEAGHDELAVLDLRALGIDAGQALLRVMPPGRLAQAALFNRYAHTEDPLECVGFAFAIERVSADIGGDFIRFIEEKLPPGVDATRCLRVHSALGADVQHLDETIRMVAGLAAPERLRIVRACFETSRLVFSQEPPPDEQTLREWFCPLGLKLA